MSLNSLAFSRVAAEVAHKGEELRSQSLDTAPKNDAQNALSALVEYLPTETVSLYLACIAALPSIHKALPAVDAWTLYWGFAVFTPVLYALVYIGTRRGARLSWWPGASAWPWWPTVAATIAFLAWGLAVPQGPFITNESSGAAAAVGALVVSALLGVGSKVFKPQ